MDGSVQYTLTLRFDTLNIDFCFPLFSNFLKFGFTPGKAEQPLQGIGLQEKEAQKDQLAYKKSLYLIHYLQSKDIAQRQTFVDQLKK